jgi:hypothetical protein
MKLFLRYATGVCAEILFAGAILLIGLLISMLAR